MAEDTRKPLTTSESIVEERHDNLTHEDQEPETLDERAMDAADGEGSALLEHDKVTRQEKDREP